MSSKQQDENKKAQIVGQYSLGAVLGRGGYGTVFSALDLENGDFVAVKQINLAKIPKDQLNGIMLEIDLLKNLHHENIVKYIKYIKTKESLYIVLEYVENGSLANIVKKFGKFPEPLVAVYIAQVLVGLQYLHEQGVVHRDIKGANILTTKGGVIKLADFGVATKFEDEGAATVVGTPYWMAPEIIELNGATTKSDIWSLGCTVIELLTGAPPYYDLGPMPALFRIVSDDYPPLPEGISPALKDWLMCCFQKDPMLRVSAQKLLKHRWIQNAKKKQPVPESMPAGDVIQDYNEKLKEKQEKVRVTKISTASGHISPRKAPPLLSTALPEDDDEDWGDVDIIPQKLNNVSKNVSIPESKTSPRSAPQSPILQSTPKLQIVKEIDGDDDWDADFDDNVPISNKKTLSLPKSEKPISKNKEPVDNQPKIPARVIISDDGDDWGDDFEDKPSKLQLLAPNNNDANNTVIENKTEPKATKKEDIEKFTEKDGDDDWSELDNKSGAPKLALASRLNSQRNRVSDVGGNADDEDDPFGAFEEENDDDFDFDTTLIKDNFAKTSETVIKMMSRLQPDESEGVILRACDDLINIFREQEDQKAHLIRHHGVIPIMEMLEVSNARVVHSVLKVVNQIISNNMEIQENLCLVGGIPAIMKFAGREYSTAIRLETASFISQMCSTSTLTLQMFIACRGLPVLVDFLVTSYSESPSLVWMSLDAISSVFELQSPTPKNDFCRLFAKAGLLRVIVSVLQSIIMDPSASKYPNIIASLLLVFSFADSVVRKTMAHPNTLIVLFDIMHSELISADVLVKILKSLKHLSMDLHTLSSLQEAGAIARLVPFLGRNEGTFVTEMHNQVLNTMYNLCRIDPERQAQAALAGIIPHLQRFITANSPLKQFALPIICDLAHVKRAREELWKHRGVEFYLDLLKERYWQVNALDSISVWLLDETNRISSILSVPANVHKIAQVFSGAEAASFENLLDPFLRIITVSLEVCVSLGTSQTFIPKLLDRLLHASSGPQVRVNLLKILTSLYENHPNPKRMIAEHHLYPVVKRLADENKTGLVKKMASKMLVAFSENAVI
eukprot:TRINITY_DN6452_c0_g1_i1.p1 TRINITY_DN6452_c0_g1~~TRINITY_DN6452_c0_g1_i1.p1  ORF type:complete len:1073 (+),score=231.94 TRINITY_DN6452_c0_g1_i1:255-3473(+)